MHRYVCIDVFEWHYVSQQLELVLHFELQITDQCAYVFCAHSGRKTS